MSDRINVIRAPRDSEHTYLAISRALAQDRRLSFEARGVLTYLLSKPSDWIVRVQDLQKEGDCGRDRIYRILKELKEAGYLHRDQEHLSNGTFAWGPYRVYEQPFTEKPDMATPQQEAAQPFTEKPYTGKPDTVKPYTENTDTYIKEKSTKERFIQTPSPTTTDEIERSGDDDGDDSIAHVLDEYNIGAADEITALYRQKYPNLDAATVRQSIENLLADNVPKGTIVNRLRNRPPAPGKPYQRSRAVVKAQSSSTPLQATKPNLPADPISPDRMRALLAERRKPPA